MNSNLKMLSVLTSHLDNLLPSVFQEQAGVFLQHNLSTLRWIGSSKVAVIMIWSKSSNAHILCLSHVDSFISQSVYPRTLESKEITLDIWVLSINRVDLSLTMHWCNFSVLNSDSGSKSYPAALFTCLPRVSIEIRRFWCPCRLPSVSLWLFSGRWFGEVEGNGCQSFQTRTKAFGLGLPSLSPTETQSN